MSWLENSIFETWWQQWDSNPCLQRDWRLKSRRAKTLLPTAETLLRTQVPDPEKQQYLLCQWQLKKVQYYNRAAKDLPKLEIGDIVRMKPIKNHECVWCKATVTQKMDDQSYVVEAPEGGTYHRNCYHLRKTGEAAPPKPIEPLVVTSENKPEIPPHSPKPSTSIVPLTVPAHTEVVSRPIRNRWPPSYLKCN